jgi:hypothetical protein
MGISQKLDVFSGRLYLGGICASDFPEQEPAYKYAKWHDLFWLLIPIAGIIAFLMCIEDRYNRFGE